MTENTNPDVEALIADLAEVRETIKSLREDERQLVEDIHQLADARKFETEYGFVELSKRNNRRWDHDELVRHLTRVVLDTREIDPETGEITSQPAWERVASAIRDCAGIGYWRIGKLRDYGLDPDEFAETTSSALSVQIK